MRTDVVTLGYVADVRAAAAEGPVDPVDALAALPAGDHVVLAWLPGVAGGARSLATARALLGRRDLAVVPLGTSSRAALTAAVAVAAVARRAPADVPLPALPVLATATAAALASWRVVGSVAGAEDPAPSLLQHAISWLPGSRFTVDLSGGTTRTGGPAALTAALAASHRAPSGLASADLPAWTATSANAQAWGQQLLVGAGVRAQDVSACGPFAGAGPEGRVARRAELSVLTLPLRQLLLDPRLHDLRACRGCERRAPAGTCRFCGHHRATDRTTDRTAHLQGASA